MNTWCDGEKVPLLKGVTAAVNISPACNWVSVEIKFWDRFVNKQRTHGGQQLTRCSLFLCQVVPVRWSSAPTATTTPTSTLARGSTAPTPTSGRTTHSTRLCQALRTASASTASTRTGHWRASSATRTPPSSSPPTRKGWAATLPQSTLLMVRTAIRKSTFLFLNKMMTKHLSGCKLVFWVITSNEKFWFSHISYPFKKHSREQLTVWQKYKKYKCTIKLNLLNSFSLMIKWKPTISFDESPEY